MRVYGWIAGALLTGSLVPFAIAQPSINPAGDQYVPRLGDIMNSVQLRHMKLWFAGKSLNWGLAAFELDQLRASLTEAASMYSGIPATNVNTMGDPIQAISKAIQARDGRKFSKAFGEMTDGCNACHRSMGRGFIVMQVPDASPFGDQVFTPKGSQ